jgi:hypothetical protein
LVACAACHAALGRDDKFSESLKQRASERLAEMRSAEFQRMPD